MNLSALLQQAVGAATGALQKEAQQQLLSVLNTNPQAFLMSLAEIVSLESESEGIRQTAGTIISRNLFNMTEDGTQFKWRTYQPQATQQIKALLLHALGSDKELAKRAASDAISKIAAIELPNGKWNQLLPALLNAAADTTPKNRKTAIMALGFICIQFKQHKIGITHKQTQQIFAAIFIGLTSDNIQIKKQSLIALSACIIYMNTILETQKFREKTLSHLLQCLNIPALVQQTLQLFLEYSKHYYQYLGEVLDHLYNATSVIISTYQETAIIAMELWRGIAEQYLQRKNIEGTQNYMLALGDKLVKLLLTCLLQVQRNDDNNLRQAAYRTLFPICEGAESVCVESVSVFVSNALTSPDWKFRQATVLAFSTITGNDSSVVKAWLQQALDQFFNLLQDKDDFVVESTLTGLTSILENKTYATIVLKKKNYQQYINVFTNLLIKSESIVCGALDALGKLTEPLPSISSCDLANNIFALLNVVTQYMLKGSTRTYRALQSASIVIIHLLQGNKNNKINREYTEYIVVEAVQLRQTVEEQNNLKMCFLVILHSAILAGKDQLDKTFSAAIASMVHNHFQSISTVDQDGLYIVGATALRMGQDFYAHFAQFSPYLSHGLTLKKEPITYRVCIGVICDVVKSIGKYIPNEIDSYLSTFLADFQEQGDRNMKGPLIAGIGDLIRETNNPNLIAKYLGNIIQIAQVSVSACIHLSTTSEDPQYVEELKQILTDFLQCLCSGLGQDCISQIPTVLNIAMTFILHTCNRQSNPTLSHFKKGLLLVFDIGSCLISTNSPQYVQLAKITFSKQEFVTIFNSLRDVPYNEQIKGINSYGRAIFSALKIQGIKYVQC